MATRTVRLDEEAEAVLRQIRKATGLSTSEALKQGLRAFSERVQAKPVRTPLEIYRSLQVGPGGWAIDSSDQVRRGMTRALKKKLHR